MANQESKPTKNPSTALGRRTFLKATAGAAALPLFVPGSVLGKDGATPASDRIVMGGIGIGNMGRGDQGNFLGRDDVQYVAVCDVVRGVRENAQNKIGRAHV